MVGAVLSPLCAVDSKAPRSMAAPFTGRASLAWGATYWAVTSYGALGGDWLLSTAADVLRRWKSLPAMLTKPGSFAAPAAGMMLSVPVMVPLKPPKALATSQPGLTQFVPT